MKKTWFAVTLSLIAVFAISFIGAEFLLPKINWNSYSESACLTDQITSDMDVYDIAKLYRDNRATVAVMVQGTYTGDGEDYISLGSGVCVASKGYETSSLTENIVASKGSYLVTNYHVIDMVYSDEYINAQIFVMPEDEQVYSCTLLWENKNLDVAVLYCEENFDYVEMKDRVIDCSAEERLDYEPLFSIGTPLELSYLNRLTLGEVASNNLLISPSSDLIEVSDYENPIMALYNTYEDVIDVTVGITNGNSGGGCFDGNGVLIGLTTMGLSAFVTDGNQMNGVVPIYPITKVLDKLISNNEKYTSYSIYTPNNLGIVGLDAYEAYYVSGLQSETPDYHYYYFEGEFYSTLLYSNDFSFEYEGYYVISNSNNIVKSISRGSIILGVAINDGQMIDVINRNDLIYALLQINDGDKVEFTYTSNRFFTNTQTVQF